jgi:hypothetical protein
MDLLNISGYSLHYVLPDLLFRGIALAADVASFDGVVQPLVMGFEPSQQTFLVMADIHSKVMMSLQQSFLYSHDKYNIDDSFFSLIVAKYYFYDAFFIIAYILNKII